MVKSVAITKKKNAKDQEVDWELVEQFKQALEDLKNGRVIKC